MKRSHHILGLGVVLACLLASCGCVDESADAGTTTFRFALWVTLVVLTGTIVAFVAGWALRQVSSRWGYGLMIMSPILLVIVVPGLFLDCVTVTEERFTLRTGFWFLPTRHDVTFEDLGHIDVTTETRRSRRGTSRSYYLLCHKKSGQMEKVPVGNLMEHAMEAILDTADRRGIPVFDKT